MRRSKISSKKHFLGTTEAFYFMHCKPPQHSMRCFLVELDSAGDFSDTP